MSTVPAVDEIKEAPQAVIGGSHSAGQGDDNPVPYEGGGGERGPIRGEEGDEKGATASHTESVARARPKKTKYQCGWCKAPLDTRVLFRGCGCGRFFCRDCINPATHQCTARAPPPPAAPL